MTQVRIYLGGLCLLSQKKTNGNEALWALMPDLTNHPGMIHCPMLIVMHDVIHGKNATVYPLEGLIDLTTGVQNGNPIQLPKTLPFFEAAKYAGRGVRLDLFGSAPIGVSARVKMPLGSDFGPAGSPDGDITVDGVGDIHTTGLAYAEVEAPDGVLHIKVKGGATVDVAPNMIAIIAAVPPSHLNLTRPIGHSKGDALPHLKAYYDLLAGTCKVDKNCPDAKATHLVNGVSDPGAGRACHTQKFEALVQLGHRMVDEGKHGGFSQAFIDPIQCSVGFGCPDDDPSC